MIFINGVLHGPEVRKGRLHGEVPLSTLMPLKIHRVKI